MGMVDQNIKSSRFRKFFYEFVGCAFLSYAFNIGGTQTYASALFIVSVMAWDVSDAHFNFGITLAESIMNIIKNSDEMTDNLIGMTIILIA